MFNKPSRKKMKKWLSFDDSFCYINGVFIGHVHSLFNYYCFVNNKVFLTKAIAYRPNIGFYPGIEFHLLLQTLLSFLNSPGSPVNITVLFVPLDKVGECIAWRRLPDLHQRRIEIVDVQRPYFVHSQMFEVFDGSLANRTQCGVFGQGREITARIAVGRAGQIVYIVCGQLVCLILQQLFEHGRTRIYVWQSDVYALGKTTQCGIVEFIWAICGAHDQYSIGAACLHLSTKQLGGHCFCIRVL
jgi:hypothetical protein